MNSITVLARSLSPLEKTRAFGKTSASLKSSTPVLMPVEYTRFFKVTSEIFEIRDSRGMLPWGGVDGTRGPSPPCGGGEWNSISASYVIVFKV